MDLVVIVGAVLVFVALSIWARQGEVRVWNGGLCQKCSTLWRNFDVDSQGGRGYKCSGCAVTRRVWISWPGVDRQRSLSL